MAIVQPRPAAAVALLRDRADGVGFEVFMVRRHVRSEFVPDVFVFPGGSVDAGDREVEELAGRCMPGEFSADTALGTGVRAAAIRELFEEAGVLLAYRADGRQLSMEALALHRVNLQRRVISLARLVEAENLILATDRLTYFAHWITPEPLPKRFDTFFFLAHLPGSQQATYDQLETTAGIWITPRLALERYGRNEFPLVFATINQLRQLQGYGEVSVAKAMDIARCTEVSTIMPRIVVRGDERIIVLPWDADYVDQGDAGR
jgi:8-oxo-dGTP pyrophosphatase MutT (NUDIX family)